MAALAGSPVGVPRRCDHADVPPNQVGRQCWKAVILAVRRPIFDDYVASFDITGFAKALAKRFHQICGKFIRCTIEKSNYRHRLLSACGQRPSRRASDETNKLAPHHVDCPEPIRGDHLNC